MTETQKARRFIIFIVLLEVVLITGLVLLFKDNKIEHQFDIPETPYKKEDVSKIVIPPSTVGVLTPIDMSKVNTKPTSNDNKINNDVEIILPTRHTQMPKSNVFYPTPLEMIQLKTNLPNTNYQVDMIVDNPTRTEIQSINFKHTPSQTTTYYHVTIK